MTFRTSSQLREVHPHVFAATAQLTHAFYRHSRHDPDHIRMVIDTHGAEDVVAVLVQQLNAAIRSPQFDVPEWTEWEIGRSEDAMQTDAELEIAEKNAEMAHLGYPAEYRTRLRAWAGGAPAEEIMKTVPLDPEDGSTVVIEHVEHIGTRQIGSD
jgi:hypothetical protein